MEKENYKKLIDSLELRINKCHEYLDDIKTTEDLKNISIKRALEVREFCIKEVDLQTKALMCDLYHIIGMGNLSALQMNKFIKLIKEYSTFRPDLKALATKLDSLSELPELPAKTRYRIQILGEFNLYRRTRDGEEEVEELEEPEDYKEIRDVKLPEEDKLQASPTELDFVQLAGNRISLDISEDTVNRLDAFLKAAKLGGTVEELYKKLERGGRYIGIDWNRKNGIAVGVMTDTTKKHIIKYVK